MIHYAQWNINQEMVTRCGITATGSALSTAVTRSMDQVTCQECNPLALGPDVARFIQARENLKAEVWSLVHPLLNWILRKVNR